MSAQRKVQILFLAANPNKERPIHWEKELMVIQNQIQESNNRDRIKLDICVAATYEDIHDAFRTYKPDIVHISVHGSRLGKIEIEHTEHDNGHIFSKENIKLLLQDLDKDLKCIVLGNCYSEKTANEINDYVDYIVSNPSYIRNPDAVIFANGFYRKIAQFAPLEQSFKSGILLLSLTEDPPTDLPILSGKNFKNPIKVTLHELKRGKETAEEIIKKESKKLEENWAKQILFGEKYFENSKFNPILSWLHTNKIEILNKIENRYLPDRRPDDKLLFKNELEILLDYLNLAMVCESISEFDEPDINFSFDEYLYQQAFNYLADRIPTRIDQNLRSEYHLFLEELYQRLEFKN